MDTLRQNSEISAGIIGGKGGMGKLFKEFFERHGIKTQVASRSTELSIEECARSSDIVVVSVPIASTIDVIMQVAPLIRPGGLLMDLTSLKSRETKIMAEYSSCEVIGCHPVFGPSVSSFEKQVIVLCPKRGEKWLSFLKPLFEKEAAVVKVSTPENHDKIMAVVQGLMHFTAITLVKTLFKSGKDQEEYNEFSSPVYRIRTDFANRILNQNPELYADIELLNPETVATLESYISSCNDLLDIVKRGDRDGFIAEFREASDYLGSYKSVAEEKTNKIIDYIASYKETKK